MAEVKVTIGGREFEVACRDGEEHFLQSAAGMLDNEAGALNEALGRMPETRMLLMAGLMLADKTASLEDQLKAAGKSDASNAPAPDQGGAAKRAQKAETQLSAVQAELAETKAQLAEVQAESNKIAITRDAALAQMDVMLEGVETVAKGLQKAG